MTRCTAISPGGSTPDGQLPAAGTQCGLPAAHDGDHCVLIPTGLPWCPTVMAAPGACSKCRARRALSNSDWCRGCWQSWFWASALNTVKAKGA